MEVMPEIPWVVTLVGFSIVSNDKYSDIPEIGNVRLEYKGEAEVAESRLVVYILDTLVKVDAHAAVFLVLLDHNFLDTFLLKTGCGFKQVVGVVDHQGMGNHERGKYPGLMGLGTARQLGGGRWNETDFSLHQIYQDVLFTCIEPESAADGTCLIKKMKDFPELIVAGDSDACHVIHHKLWVNR